MKIKLSDYLWNFVAKQDIKDVFMFPGGGAMHLVDSLGRCEQARAITLLHEQACSMAAETYGRISNNMGAILVTTGPGGTNAITGVAAAWMESTPMLVVSGQVKTSDLSGDTGVRQLGNQEIGIVKIVESITKYAVMVTEPKMIKYHLERAFWEARRGRPGPVWLDIPLDVQAAMIDTDDLVDFVPPMNKTKSYIPYSQDVKEVAAMLSDSSRPVMIVGQGIERGNGIKCFRILADKLGIPILTSWMAAELLPYDHYCNLGKPGMVAPRYSNWAMQHADLIIAVGTRLDPAMIGYNPDDFAPEARKIVVDIDRAEIDKFKFHIDKKIVADAAKFIEQLDSELVATGYDNSSKRDWLERCLNYKDKHPVVLKEFIEQKEFVNPYYFIDQLSDCLADDEIVIPGSSGTTLDIFWLCLKNKKGQRALSTGALGSMGYGIPAAIGAAVASKKRVVCVEGDGSVQLNIQEFADIKGLDLPIKIFILDNGGYLSIMNTQRSHFQGRLVGASPDSGLHLPDIVSVAKAYGFNTFEIRDHTEISDIIKQVLATEGPVLCRVVLRNDIVVQPRVISRVTENGSMVSGSLSDMWPFVGEPEGE